jgi:hypothetical protein
VHIRSSNTNAFRRFLTFLRGRTRDDQPETGSDHAAPFQVRGFFIGDIHRCGLRLRLFVLLEAQVTVIEMIENPVVIL